jgi:hypothetical protein
VSVRESVTVSLLPAQLALALAELALVVDPLSPSGLSYEAAEEELVKAAGIAKLPSVVREQGLAVQR